MYAVIFLLLSKAWNFTIRWVAEIIPPEYWSTVVVIIPHLIFQRFFSKARTIELCWLINYFFCSKTLTLQYVEKKGNHLIKFGYFVQNKSRYLDIFLGEFWTIITPLKSWTSETFSNIFYKQIHNLDYTYCLDSRKKSYIHTSTPSFTGVWLEIIPLRKVLVSLVFSKRTDKSFATKDF